MIQNQTSRLNKPGGLGDMEESVRILFHSTNISPRLTKEPHILPDSTVISVNNADAVIRFDRMRLLYLQNDIKILSEINQ